jgi:hypothetical protein
MRWFRRWCPNHEQEVAVPTEEEGREARTQAETAFRQTTEQWPQVHEVSAMVEAARNRTGPDPFVEELARAMRARQRNREA